MRKFSKKDSSAIIAVYDGVAYDPSNYLHQHALKNELAEIRGERIVELPQVRVDFLYSQKEN